MSDIIYTNFLKELLSGTINLATDPIYVMLLSGSYTPSTSHSTVADVVSHQVVDPLGSYLSGGKQLTSPTLSTSSNSAYFDAADISWSSATITCSGAVVFYSGGTSNSAKKLIVWKELGNTSSTNGTFQITWNNTYGIFRVYGA
jgi:hypothetical protein